MNCAAPHSAAEVGRVALHGIEDAYRAATRQCWPTRIGTLPRVPDLGPNTQKLQVHRDLVHSGSIRTVLQGVVGLVLHESCWGERDGKAARGPPILGLSSNDQAPCVGSDTQGLQVPTSCVGEQTREVIATPFARLLP